MDCSRNALVLTGGGARGAFQSGVIKALVEIGLRCGATQPFPYVSGLSAGSLSAAYYAATCDQLPQGSQKLAEFWSVMESRQVFRSDLPSLGSVAMRWLTDLAFGGLTKNVGIKSLLDTSPMRKFLAEHIPFGNIRHNIANGVLSALEMTATNYTDSENTSFIQASEEVLQRYLRKRRSLNTEIHVDHILASASIPIFFPPVKIYGDYFGDGCLRNSAPLSPAIRLGARKLFIVGVRHQSLDAPKPTLSQPLMASVGRIMSVVLNAVLLDATEVDLERLKRINDVIKYVPQDQREELHLRHIDYMFLRPSEDIGQMGKYFFRKLPKALRYLIDGLGSNEEASELISYLLFDPEYGNYLVDLGYRDALQREEEIAALFLR